MADSPYEELLKKQELILLEDDQAAVLLNPDAKIPGQLMVIPKQKHVIMEDVPDALLGHLGVLANRASTAVFEALGAHGTNILIANGVEAGQTVPHFAIHVIPRRENDGVGMQWKPKQSNEEELNLTALMLEQEHKPAQKMPEQKARSDADTHAQDYLVNQLKRLP